MGKDKKFDALVIQQYLAGQLDPRQMNQLERKALDDPFLADALEGYAHTKKPLEHQLSILQKQLEERIAVQQDNKNYFNFSWQRLSTAAAAGLMFITVGILFWMKTPDNSKIAATTKKVEVELTPQAASGANKTAQQEQVSPRNDKKIVKSSPSELIPKKPATSLVHPATVSLAATTGPEALAKSKLSGDLVTGGVVSEAHGQPLPGASVKIRGTDIAAITDYNGRFILPDTAKGILDVNYSGFEQKEVNVSPGDRLAVVLSPSKSSLDEVAVNAYGVNSARKGVAAASVSTISGPGPVAGWQKFQEYIAKNIRYPKLETKVSGDVIIGFSVNSKGRPENIHIIKSLNPLCDAEAIRLIKAGPDWKVISDNVSEARANINFRP